LGYDEEYFKFASRISFFDFREDMPEFKESDFDFTKVGKVTEMLQATKNWDVASLSSFVKTNPSSIKIVEGLFQQLRFSNTQLTYFAFDVTKLNSSNLDQQYDYAIRNLNNDPYCLRLFLETLPKAGLPQPEKDLSQVLKNLSKETVAACFKISISEWVPRADKDFRIFHDRIINPAFEDVSYRFAEYSLRVLRLNDTLQVLDANKFLQNKRIPADNKSLHGNYAKTVITQILDNHGFKNADEYLKKEKITTLEWKVDLQANTLDGNDNFYCTEKSVKAVLTDKGRPKKFDFLLFVSGKPEHLFEVNFYTTAGTKIGINESEYVALNEDIKKNTPFKFHWITDGNYWLSAEGKRRYVRLLNKFDAVYNINTFEENLSRFK
jgi:hypothetical protein